jgi:HlyD family secretion protein
MRKLLMAAALIFGVCADGNAQAPDPPVRGGSVRGTGTLLPEDLVDVNSLVQGRIQKIHPAGEWNAIVKKGDPLAEIDSTLFEADLRIARANIDSAEAEMQLAKARSAEATRELNRARESLATGSAGRPEIDKRTGLLEVAKAELAVGEAKTARARASLERAKIDLDACVLRSPIDGVVIDRRATIGQLANPWSSAPSLFLVAGDLNRLEVLTLVREADIPRVAKGQAATFKVDAFPNETFKGEVAQIRLNATLQKDGVTYFVVIRTDNSARRLLPYMSAQVTIETGKAK